MLVLLLSNFVCLALAQTTNASLEVIPTALMHYKSFSFEYESSLEDDLEVDVQASKNVEDDLQLVKRACVCDGSSEISAETSSESKKGNVVWVTRYTAPSSSEPTSSPILLATPSLPVNVEVAQTVYQIVTQTAYQTDLQTAYLTIPHYMTVTQPMIHTVTQPVIQTVTQPVIQTVTQPVFQTVTQPAFQPVSNTVTVTSTVVCGDGANCYQQGYNDGMNASGGQCSNSEYEFQSGFINGARWAYEVGYTDGTRGKPLCVPSFYTTSQGLPSPPTLLPVPAETSPPAIVHANGPPSPIPIAPCGANPPYPYYAGNPYARYDF